MKPFAEKMTITHDGKEFSVSGNICLDNTLAELPDGTLLEVTSMTKAIPPRPSTLKVRRTAPDNWMVYNARLVEASTVH